MSGAVGNKRNITLAQLAYPTNGASVVSGLIPTNEQLFIQSYSLYNGSGSASDLGLGISQAFMIYRYTAIGNAVVNITAPIVNGGATSIFSITNNDGFIINSMQRFGFVRFNLTQGSSGSPAFSYQYWNGSGWASLTLTQSPTYSTGQVYIVFNPPVDWVPGSDTTISMGYCIRVRATTASSQAIIANSSTVARWIYYNLQLPTNTRSQAIFDDHPYLLEGNESLQPYFSSASNANTVEVSYQAMP